MSQFYLILPLIVITSTLVFPFGMHVATKYNSRIAVAIGAFLVLGSNFLASYTSNVFLFFVLYALGFGVGKGFLYPAPLAAGWSHLSERRGLVSGLVVSGLGIGAFIFGMVVAQICNPNNEAPIMV